MQACLFLSNIPPICSDATLHSLLSSHLPLQSLVIPREAGFTRGFASLRLRYSNELQLKRYAALVRSLTFPDLCFNRFTVQEDPGGRLFASRLREAGGRKHNEVCGSTSPGRQGDKPPRRTLETQGTASDKCDPVAKMNRWIEIRRDPMSEQDQWPPVPRKKKRTVNFAEESSEFNKLHRHISSRPLTSCLENQCREKRQTPSASHCKGRERNALLEGGYRGFKEKSSLPKPLPKYACGAHRMFTARRREGYGSSEIEENARLRKRKTSEPRQTKVKQRKVEERVPEKPAGGLKKALRRRVRTCELDSVLEQVRLKRRKKEAKKAHLGVGYQDGPESSACTRLRATTAVLGMRGECYSKGGATTDGDSCKELQHMPKGKSVACSDSRIHGTGLFAMEAIATGEFVIEYGGTRGPKGSEDRLQEEYERRGIKDSYIFQLPDGSVIDGTMSESLSRYINHSCDANVCAYSVEYGGTSKVMFYAARNIAIGEEITCDYRFELEEENKKIPCLCGARICQGYLNYDPFGLRGDEKSVNM